MKSHIRMHLKAIAFYILCLGPRKLSVFCISILYASIKEGAPHMEYVRANSLIHTHSFVISPLGPVAVANFGSMPWVSRMCLAAGLSRNLDNEEAR